MLLSERHFTRLVPRVIENLQLTVITQGTAAGCDHGSWEGQASQKAGTRRCRLPPRGLLSPRLSHRRARRGVCGRCVARRRWLRDGHSHPGGRPPRPLHGLPHRPHASIPASSRLLRWPACSRVPTSVSVTGRDVLRAECLCPSQCVCCYPTPQRGGASRQGFRGAIGARRESPHVRVPRTRLLPSALCHVRTPREGGHRPTRRRALPRHPTDRRLLVGLPASGTGE